MFTIEYKLPEKGKAITVDDMKEIKGAVLVPERFLHRRELFKNTPIFMIRFEGITPDAQATFMDDPRLVADHVINWLLKVTKQLDAAFEDFDEALFLQGDREAILTAGRTIVEEQSKVGYLMAAGHYFEGNTMYVSDIKDEHIQLLRDYQQTVERVLYPTEGTK